MFDVCWRQHGGSGLSIDWASALELMVADRDALIAAIAERRGEEAKALKGGA